MMSIITHSPHSTKKHVLPEDRSARVGVTQDGILWTLFLNSRKLAPLPCSSLRARALSLSSSGYSQSQVLSLLSQYCDKTFWAKQPGKGKGLFGLCFLITVLHYRKPGQELTQKHGGQNWSRRHKGMALRALLPQRAQFAGFTTRGPTAQM